MTSDETTARSPAATARLPLPMTPNEFWLRTLLRWYIGLVIRPSPTIREIVERRPPLRFGLVTVIWGILVSLGASSVSVWLLDRPEGLVFPPGQMNQRKLGCRGCLVSRNLWGCGQLCSDLGNYAALDREDLQKQW